MLALCHARRMWWCHTLCHNICLTNVVPPEIFLSELTFLACNIRYLCQNPMQDTQATTRYKPQSQGDYPTYWISFNTYIMYYVNHVPPCLACLLQGPYLPLSELAPQDAATTQLVSRHPQSIFNPHPRDRGPLHSRCTYIETIHVAVNVGVFLAARWLHGRCCCDSDAWTWSTKQDCTLAEAITVCLGLVDCKPVHCE